MTVYDNNTQWKPKQISDQVKQIINIQQTEFYRNRIKNKIDIQQTNNEQVIKMMCLILLNRIFSDERKLRH